MSIVKQGAKAAVPKLRFPEFHKAAAWDEKTLASVCDRITQGGTPDTSVASYWDGDVAWITPAEMGKSDDPHVGSTVRHITDEGLQACSSGLLPVHSVIISTRAPIGHLAINTVPMAINQGCKGIVPGSGLEYRFLLASLLLAKPRLNDLGAGNTFKELSASALKSFAIGVPSRAEQQKIADCLTSLDEVIAAQGRKVEALKTHKRGLMQQLFPREGETVPRLRFPEFRDAPEWETRPLGLVIQVASGQVDPTESPYCDWPHVGGDNIEPETGNLAGLRSAREDGVISGKYLFDERDVLYSKIRPVLNKVAVPAFRGICSADIYPIRPSNSDVTREFLAYLLRSVSFVEYATKNSERGKIPKINREALAAYSAPLPKPSEQKRIADCLSSLDTQITAETHQLAALKTHKQGLMQQLFPAPEAAGA